MTIADETGTPPALAFEDVVATYAGGVTAVAGVSASIAPHAFVALVGASGSGKSTLLKTINRLVAPTGGRVRIGGRDAADLPPTALRRGIGYVFQGVGLFPHMTVGENIALPGRLAGVPLPSTRVAALLDLVELPAAFAGRLPAALSGGQRQRVGVARALAAGADLLLMDEPFGALDPVTRDVLGRRVRALHDELDLTTVMVTHDMAEALILADRVMVMADGRLVDDETPAALMASAGSAAAAALMAVPRAQAAALSALAGGVRA